MPVRLMILGALLTLQKRVSFLETFLFVGRISLFFYKEQISFSLLILYVRDSAQYLGKSLFPFLTPQKGRIQLYIRTRNIF